MIIIKHMLVVKICIWSQPRYICSIDGITSNFYTFSTWLIVNCAVSFAYSNGGWNWPWEPSINCECPTTFGSLIQPSLYSYLLSTCKSLCSSFFSSILWFVFYIELVLFHLVMNVFLLVYCCHWCFVSVILWWFFLRLPQKLAIFQRLYEQYY